MQIQDNEPEVARLLQDLGSAAAQGEVEAIELTREKFLDGSGWLLGL